MKLRSSILLGLSLPFLTLGLGDAGRFACASASAPVGYPDQESYGWAAAEDYTDTGVGCVDDCLEPEATR